MTAKEIVDCLREKYLPVTSDGTHRDERYCCVGGAPIKEGLLPDEDGARVWRLGCFPSIGYLSLALWRVGVSADRANYLSTMIVTTNEDEDFDAAWGWLETALAESNLVDKGAS